MATLSRPDPGSPAQVSSATFPTVRRGFDQDAVSRFLRAVAGELQRAHDRVDALEQQLRAASAASGPNPAIDDDTAVRLLGEEAARVLQTAREAAAQIKARAEEAAARLVREAHDEAARVRAEADEEAARRRADAAADAEAEVEMARQQGREMVEEARAYRERVLADVARRRELARQQIEALVHGRERVVQAFERARLAASDVLASMGHPDSQLVTDLPEMVNLEPTTGPVPVVDAPPPSPAPEPEAGEGPEPDSAATPEPEPEVEPPFEQEPEAQAELDDDRVIPLPARPLQPAEPVDDEPSEAEPAPVVALFAGEIDEAPAAEPPVAKGVDDLFARLRAASAETVAREVSEAAPPAAAPDSTDAFAQREEALVPIIVATARKMKRVLAEEQNSLFDAVRQQTAKRQPMAEIDALLPPITDHVALYRAALDEHLRAAAMIGAASLSGEAREALATQLTDPSVLAPLDDALREDVVQPLRDRLERCLHDADGDAEEFIGLARSAYREWKSQHVDEHVDDLVRLAHGRGAFAAVAPGSGICWLVDPNGPACPDAEDNALAGTVAAGESFPTGHQHPPAHAGCRCLLGLADG